MSRYSYGQLEGLWIAQGGSRLTAPVAAAIAMAESSGDSGVTSSNPDGGKNVGLWQLDTRGKGAGYSVAQLQDPATNARLAVRGSNNGGDWSAWATFASGAFRKYLQNTPPLPAPHGGGGRVPPGSTGLPGIPGLGQLASLFGSLGTAIDWLLQPSHWVRIISFAVGAGLVGAGLVMLAFI